MSKVSKIVIIGNSVALRVRPPLEAPHNKNYGSVLQDLLSSEYPEQTFLVNNKGLSRLLISEVFERFDEYVQEFPDYYIINLGVVDASTREIPLWYANMMRSEKNSLLHQLINGIHYHLIKRHHAFFVKLRGKKTWISERKFEHYYRRLLGELKKETNARFITLSVNAGNDRIETKIPGSLKNYVKYNELIQKVSAEFGAKYIDTLEIMVSEEVPDGIHFSAEGHQKLAEKIKNVILKNDF